MENESEEKLKEFNRVLAEKSRHLSPTFWDLFFIGPWTFRLPLWVNADQEEKQQILVKYVAGKLIWLLILLVILVFVLQLV
mgnify:CR=1 FL=1